MFPTPVLIYDGDCGFCKYWVEKWKKITGPAVNYAPYQAAAVQFPQIKIEEFKQAVKLVDENHKTYTAAHAVLKSLAYNPRFAQPLNLYEKLAFFRWICETGYNWVAQNRHWLSKLFR